VSRKTGEKLKLRITIDGKTYEAEVEILDSEGSAPEYPAYPPVAPSFVPASLPEPLSMPQTAMEENPKECRSPVTGMVIKVNAEPGQAVELNDAVVVLESMKMEMQITAPQAGVVKNVLVTPGSSVKVNQLLVEFE
jgi:methylmalonyl-CoA carboxyltransferase small subunit